MHFRQFLETYKNNDNFVFTAPYQGIPVGSTGVVTGTSRDIYDVTIKYRDALPSFQKRIVLAKDLERVTKKVTQPREFAQQQAIQENKFYVYLFYVYGSTSGTHGFRGRDETPASDPAPRAEWTVHLENPKSWNLLKGQEILVDDGSGGSYHERWLKLDVYAYVTEEIYSQLEQLEPNLQGLDSKLKKVHRFIYRNYKQTVNEIKTISGVEKNPVLSGETSDDYWGRLGRAGSAGKPPRPEGWDGD